MNNTTTSALTDDVLDEIIAGAKTSMEQYLALSLKAERAAIRKSRCGNSPVIPDGWALVPIKPTEDMIISGFESAPNEFFGDPKIWDEYSQLTGCQQAARRAELCWAAMIAAAPAQEDGQ